MHPHFHPSRRPTPLLLLTPLLLATLLLLAACGDEDAAPTPGPNDPPLAVLTLPERAQVGVPALLDASASSDADGAIAYYTFDLGIEGPTQFLESASPAIWHTFAEPGAFTIMLSVVDDDGAKASTSEELEVVAP